ncbi:hypothetical protein PRIPAC_81917 [Pristionchus pacificus]|uniref:GTP cyclohydrolase 1 feedback regulatory protein n=1 Tax=Pristionchus pacificus TaxID=54126 RepID=A0A454XXW7_PRIPA|nr:hypothetical protein PRIPAC_81917 [Pristionchus pacificus]|eukprot:PDM69930.1 hypothetical protein PRIPAC_49142 [Pristionchus pacificus]
MPDTYLTVVGMRSFYEFSRTSYRDARSTHISGDKIDQAIINYFVQRKIQVTFYDEEKQEIYVECPGSRVLNYLATLGWRVVTMTALPLEEDKPAQFAWTLFKD